MSIEILPNLFFVFAKKRFLQAKSCKVNLKQACFIRKLAKLSQIILYITPLVQVNVLHNQQLFYSL